jgi:hypothetical protein
MSPNERWRLLEALSAALPLPQDCECNSHIGCDCPGECKRALAEEVLEVIERETVSV